MSFRYRTYIGPYVQCVGAGGNHFEISEAIKQRLTSPTGASDGSLYVHLWLPNVAYPHRQLRLEDTAFALIEIMPASIEFEKVWFESEFTRELTLMRARYYSNMRVAWGIVQDGV